MTSLTTWLRCEPHARNADIAPGLEMRVADPLWLLGRQWQFGEFMGDDAGSPVWASCAGAILPLAQYLPGPVAGHAAADVQAYAAEQPLDALVEREQPLAGSALQADRRLAVEAGAQFLSQLPEALADSERARLLQSFGVVRLTGAARNAIDAESLLWLDLVSGRALDGKLILDAVLGVSAQEGAVALGFDSADQPAAASAITAWLDWLRDTIGPTAAPASARSSWNATRMEYSFAVAAPSDAQGGQLLLEVAEHDGDGLDWYDFDRRAGQLAQANSAQPLPLAAASAPTGVTFRGMPSRRLWEFEDAQVNLGGISAAATDLTRMLFIEFMLQYANDYFVIPVDVPIGSVCRIDSVDILNCFGETTRARPIADASWRMYTLTDASAAGAATSPLLFVPPVVAGKAAGEPIERLQLVRDEMANLCWAIEQIVPSATGKPLNRREAWQAARQARAPARPPAQGSTLQYQLDTWADAAPDYWFPLVNDLASTGLLALQSTGVSQPAGALLADLASTGGRRLYDEEIPRSGAVVERLWQSCRWRDGAIHTWITRHKRVGRGEGSSGLAFDVTKVG